MGGLRRILRQRPASWRARTVASAIAAALIAALAFAASAQDAPPEGEAQPPLVEDPLARLEVQRAALGEEIEQLEQRLASSTPTAEGAQRLDALRTLDLVLARQRELLRGGSELDAREEEGQERLASGPEGLLANPPPYLLAVFDALADARDAQLQGVTTLEAALDAARRAAESAEETAEEAGRERRRAAEAVETEPDGASSASLRTALRRAELASRTALARRDLARIELGNLERKIALQRGDIRLLEETVSWVRENLELDPGAAEAARRQLGDREFEAQRQRDEAEREAGNAEKRLAEAERRLDADPTSAVRAAEVEGRRAELRRAQRASEFATGALARIEAQRLLEERRLRMLGGDVPRSELLDWRNELERGRAESERNLRLLEIRGGEVRQELTRARAAAGSTDAGVQRWAERRVAALEEIVALHAEGEMSWRTVDTLAGRVLADLEERTERPSLGDRLDDVVRGLTAAWQFELFTAEDRPITVGKIATGLLLFVLGFLVSRVASRLLGRLLVRRAKLAAGAATAIQGLVFYVFLVIFFLIALRSVNIPLTAFTVLGGALAIGVGFGSQNIVNNFISGLILLAERPIKVGDTIEVDGERGTVEWIGPRSTRVRTFDNIHIIVPNSAFLEKNVINWTLSDTDVRASVNVGVAYGSPTREVRDLLHRAIDEQEKVLSHPEPLVLFYSFGDDALLFRAHFWIRSRNMPERLMIESEVRYRIDDLFREAGITIAFPQRDVHLDVAEPLPVRVISGDPPAAD